MLTKAEEKEYTKDSYDVIESNTYLLSNKEVETEAKTLIVENESNSESSKSEEISEEEKRIRAAELRAREAEEAQIKAEKEQAERKKAEEEARIREAERIAREKEIAEIKAEEEAKKRIENEKTEPQNNLIQPQFGRFDHVADYSSLNNDKKELKRLNEDDYLNGDDLPAQKEYRDILNKIFSNDVSPDIFKQTEKIENKTENDEIVSDVIVDDLDFSSMRRHEPAQDLFADEEKAVESASSCKQKVNESAKNKNKASAYDYSDIIKLSEDEGFKISTADNTNKNELGKILVNKLNFHTALIFFAIVAIETFIVALTMESTAKFGIGTYFIFVGIIAVLPIAFGIIYYLTPKRVVNDIGTFKSAFETALIITLNIVLLIIAFAIVTNLDFSSAMYLTRGIFIPIMISVNVPVFVIVKHSLLENQAYFS